MLRLDGASAFMVYNDVPRCYQHTLKIAVLNWNNSDEEYSYEKLVENLKKAPERFPILKWKLARVPMGLNHPVWIQDLDFDISHHIRRIACPGGKNKQAISELISELYAHPLDQSLPPWQMWIVEGLPDNQVSVVTLLHHAYADGAGASILMQGIMSSDNALDVKTSDEMGVNSHKNPGKLHLLARGLIDLPLIFLRHAPSLVKAIKKQKRLNKNYEASGKPLPADPKKAPDSPLNTVYSHGRTFAYDYYDMAHFKSVSKYFNVTLNDLLIAIVSGAIRKFYLTNGHNPDKPLVSIIPINARTEEQQSEVLGNHLDNGSVFCPIHLEDPIERLTASAESANIMKEHRKNVGGQPLAKALELLPPLATSLTNRALKRANGQLKLLGNLGISNVRGPAKPMKIAGGEVAHWLSIGQITAGVGVNVTAWSYVDKYSICLMADRKVIKDGALFMEYIRDSFNEYQALCSQPAAAAV